MKKWRLIVDVGKCEDCNNCFLSCKDEFVDNEFLGYSVPQPRHEHKWVNIMRRERGQCPMIDVAYLPIFCMHCDRAPCISKTKNGAVYKRDDGIVLIHPIKAKGQKEIVGACPYGAIWWNDELQVAQKCSLCAHLLDEGWKEPRCVQSCPTGALKFIQAEDSEIEKIRESENLEILHPGFGTMPRVFYKNLHLYFRCFIGGSIAVTKNGISDCAEGVRITLMKDSEIVNETLSDNYGDFKFDNLEENSGEYEIEISLEGYSKKRIKINLATSTNLGCLYLEHKA
jgi:Fe-S-cluster-containing dehydrogenase component